MNPDDIEVALDPRSDPMIGRTSRTDPRTDTSLGELLKRLTSDTGELIRKEAELAKAEMRETGTALLGDARNLGIALGLGVAGGLALVAFLVIALGNLLGGAYWLSALLIGVVAIGVGLVLAKNAMSDISNRGITPKQTIETLREDKAWMGQQAREMSDDLRADPTTPAIRR